MKNFFQKHFFAILLGIITVIFLLLDLNGCFSSKSKKQNAVKTESLKNVKVIWEEEDKEIRMKFRKVEIEGKQFILIYSPGYQKKMFRIIEVSE